MNASAARDLTMWPSGDMKVIPGDFCSSAAIRTADMASQIQVEAPLPCSVPRIQLTSHVGKMVFRDAQQQGRAYLVFHVVKNFEKGNYRFLGEAKPLAGQHANWQDDTVTTFGVVIEDAGVLCFWVDEIKGQSFHQEESTNPCNTWAHKISDYIALISPLALIWVIVDMKDLD
jgi:hypothetical protein